MKAVGLFSGGLDSALAIKLVQKQENIWYANYLCKYVPYPFFENSSLIKCSGLVI